MKGILNSAQIEYVLKHLGQHIHLNNAIRDSFVFVAAGSDLSEYTNRIIFLLSEKPLQISDVKTIDEIQVLFPLSGENSYFSQKNGNIIFNHDILKSVFYLLSGFQELNHNSPDSLGRFSFKASVQAKLNITDKPVVNYYFEEIIKGIEIFCKLHQIEFRRNSQFNNFAFFLTHDVDRIQYYNLNTFLYLFKTLFTKKQSSKKRSENLKELLNTAYHILNVFDKKDLYWNFREISDLEKKLGVNSTFFFLPKDRRHVDSYYNLRDRKIAELIQFLKDENHEIGLHGTVRSSESADAIKKIHSDFLSAADLSITGIRQHRLMWNHPSTAINHCECGIAYDSTLGYAEHEGFRNSYCHPFKIFDFKNNCTLPYWEIPLNVMDSTLFHYRKLSLNEAMLSAEKIRDEVIRFNGVFTLLWHNSYFNEKEVPGVTRFYASLLQKIMAEKPEVLTGLQIVQRLSDTGNNG